MAVIEIWFHSTRGTHTIIVWLQKSIPSATKDTLGKKGTKFAEKLSSPLAHCKLKKGKLVKYITILITDYQVKKSCTYHGWAHQHSTKVKQLQNLGKTHLQFWNSQTFRYEKSKMQVLKSFPPLLLHQISQVCPFSQDVPN